MLIKPAKSGRLLKDAIVLDMGDLGRQADRILTEARQEAALVLAEARETAERLVAAADERGHAEGYQRGLVEGQGAGEAKGKEAAFAQQDQALKQVVTKWTQALERWEQQRQELLHEAREDVVRFAFALARKVVHRMPTSDPTIVRDQVAAALESASCATSIDIAINPGDRSFIEESLPHLLANAARFQHAVIVEDASIAAGGCVVRTRHGQVDADIDSQLDRIAAAIVPERVDPPSRDERAS